MNFIQQLIENYKKRKQEKRERREEQERINTLNEILDKQLPTANIIEGENYKDEVEFFLMEIAPRKLREYLQENLEVSCKFVQLTGEDAGEEFYVSKPCFLEKHKNGAQSYFLLSETDLSVSVNCYLNCFVQTKNLPTYLEKYYGSVMTIRDVFKLRDAKHWKEEGDSVDLNNEEFVSKLVRLDRCKDILSRRKDNEISYRKG